MRTLKRECSVQLRLDTAGRVDIFRLLSEKGVNVKQDLLCVEELPNRFWDVTFKTVALRKLYWPTLSRAEGMTATCYADTTKTINVLHVPFEQEDNVVRFILGRYGKVVRGRYLTHADYPDIFNGIRQYQMELNEDIPSSLHIGGRYCWVRYYGQPRTCLKCNGRDHLAKDCNQVRCFKCRQLGHVARECIGVTLCTLCGELGHTERACPLSFANRAKPKRNEWDEGGAQVGENLIDLEVVPETQDPEERVAGDEGEKNPATVDPPIGEQSLFDDDDVELTTQEEQVTPSPVIADNVAPSTSPTSVDPPPPLAPTTSTKDEVILSTTTTSTSTSVDPPASGIMDDSRVVKDWSSQPTPQPSERMESDDQTPFLIVKKRSRGNSLSPPPAKSGRLSRNDSSSRVAQEKLKACAIFHGQKPWVRCTIQGCGDTFRTSSSLLTHMSQVHRQTKLGRPDCPLKSCNANFTDHRDWLQHLGTKHPQYVSLHDVDFFDNYWLHP